MAAEIELPEIQGNVLCAYALPLTRYCHFCFDTPEGGRAFVAAVTPEVTTSEDTRPDGGSWSTDKPESTVNIAFTFRGLAGLGLEHAALAGFPLEFQQGMRRRAWIMVDRGSSAPEHWESVWRGEEVHACVTLYGSDARALETRAAWLEACRAAAGGVTMVDAQDAGALVVDGKVTTKEHFGFNDGFGNPEIEGAGCPSRPGRGKIMPGGKWAPIATGEFILGYRNENGEVALTPEPSQLFRNGTYMVYRKLHENVASFRAYVADEGAKYPGGPAHLAAKMIGRWQDGTPLELSPDKPDPALGGDEQRHNDFVYGADPTGARCPMGAHIRRANPRDAQGFGGILTNPHRIMRRGVPYGPWTPLDQPVTDNGNHGIIFVAYNASIENQFEFVQQQWMNYGNDFGMGNDKDPVIGSHLDNDVHVIGADGINPLHICRKLPQFVETRGGDYFFVPSRTALRLLSDSLARAPRVVAAAPGPAAHASAFDRLFAGLESIAKRLPVIGEPLEHELEKIHDAVEKFAAHVQREALHADPEPLFAILRRIKPVVHVGKFALVTRFADCEDCLMHDDVFAQPYEAKFKLLTGGTNFFLGMANTPEYTHDVSAMRMVIRREDIPDRIVPFVRTTAESLVAASGGRLEIVSGLTSAVPTALVGDYFGTPDRRGEFAAQSAVMSAWLFLPNAGTPAPSIAAAEAMREVLRVEVAARKADRGRRDDVLERLFVLQDAGQPRITDAWILDQLFSFVVAAIPTTSAAVARAIDELMRRPKELAGAQVAARAGDTALVGKYINEAMRFSPLGPGVFRTTTAQYTIGAGTMHATTIPAGTTVLVSLLSAMFDSERIDRPNSFVIDRPAWASMPFGFGLHTCFGQYINVVQMPLIAQAILSRRNLRRAKGSAGTLQFDGSFPSSLTLEFDP